MDDAQLMSQEDRAALLGNLRDLRNAQGFALNAAAIFIEVSTAASAEERADVAQQFRTFRDLYGKTIRDATSNRGLRARDARADGLVKVALEAAERFGALDEHENFAGVPTQEAGKLVNFVRLQGVPAIMQLIGILSSAKKEHDKVLQSVMQERIGQLDKMFTEVEDIGRMIHMISLNASVEAARAGGESGRSFKVIADEIRGLAQQASTLIETTRNGVLPSAEADILGMVQPR
ncbi:MAG: methyl-accepting chemotaxis protein [Pseudomonadota bacterium]